MNRFSPDSILNYTYKSINIKGGDHLERKKFILFKQNRTILVEKVRESLTSVLPITAIVFLLCFSLIPVPNSILMAFVIGAVFLILGMGLFTLGTDLGMTPIGQHVGSAITKSKSIFLIVLVCFLVGTIITISEPDLQVLAEQVPNVPNMVLILAVAVGVGIFLVVSLLRILLKIKLAYLLIGFYLIVFILAQFVPLDFLAVAFDSGGVTTGPMTVPFIMALGVGVASIRSDRDATNDSFGLVALCSIGPIVAVMILGILYNPESAVQSAVSMPDVSDSVELSMLFISALPRYFKEVGVALLPMVFFFLGLQAWKLKLSKHQLIHIIVGVGYTYIGLVLFLTGVNIGFMPAGNYLGQQLGSLAHPAILIPIGALIGYFIVAAEPAVHVLNKQVFDITAGAIPSKALSTSLSIGVAISVALAMMRIVVGMPIMYLLVPGYLIAAVLTFFTPPIFTAIAFDSGGVASGPMTATFLLPLAMGACSALGGDVTTDAFGVVAMVAMTPLITIQVLGLYFKLKTERGERHAEETTAIMDHNHKKREIED